MLKEKSKRVTMLLPQRLVDSLSAYAEASNQSMSNVLRSLLEEAAPIFDQYTKTARANQAKVARLTMEISGSVSTALLHQLQEQATSGLQESLPTGDGDRD